MDYTMWDDVESKLKCEMPYWQIKQYTGVREEDIKKKVMTRYETVMTQ